MFCTFAQIKRPVLTIEDVFNALYVMFIDNKIPYPERPGNSINRAYLILAVSTTYDVIRETERRI